MLRRSGNGREPGEGALRYSPEEQLAVEKHLAEQFGPSDRRFQQSGQGLSVPLFPPAGERKGYLLSTLGLGAAVMAPPEGEADKDLCRAEVYLPMVPGWEPQETDPWPAGALAELAALPLEQPRYWIGPGRILELPGEAARGGGQCFLLILPPQEPWADAAPCPLLGGGLVQLYQGVLLYRQEAELLAARGLPALLEKLGECPFLADPERKNCCGS